MSDHIVIGAGRTRPLHAGEPRPADVPHPVTYRAADLLRRAEMARARAMYADVIEALEQHVVTVDMDDCGNELNIIVPLAEDQYIVIAGRYSLPWSNDRDELGGWLAVHVDDRYGTRKAVYDTTTPDGDPPGDLSLKPLAEEVGAYVDGWHAEHG